MAGISAPVQRMVDATNAGDSAAFLACFTDDAFLSDWGREFHGHAGVARWDQTDNIGRHSHFEATGQRAQGDDLVVTLVVTGGGFNGTSDIVFTLRDDLIARLVISPD